MKKAMKTGLAVLFVMATMTSCKDSDRPETENVNTEVTGGERTTDETAVSSADTIGTDVPGTTGGEMEQVP